MRLIAHLEIQAVTSCIAFQHIFVQEADHNVHLGIRPCSITVTRQCKLHAFQSKTLGAIKCSGRSLENYSRRRELPRKCRTGPKTGSSILRLPRQYCERRTAFRSNLRGVEAAHLRTRRLKRGVSGRIRDGAVRGDKDQLATGYR
jgi:hypothetical protein